jgi:hypothetical protein
MLENYALPEFNNSNNLVLHVDGAPVHFSHNGYDCLNVSFPG